METKAENAPPPPPQPQRIANKQQAGKNANAGPNGVQNQVKPLVKPEPTTPMDQSFGNQNEDRKPFNQGGNRQNFGGRGRGAGNRNFGGGRGGPGGGNNRNFQQNRNQNNQNHQNQDVSRLFFHYKFYASTKFSFSKWLLSDGTYYSYAMTIPACQNFFFYCVAASIVVKMSKSELSFCHEFNFNHAIRLRIIFSLSIKLICR